MKRRNNHRARIATALMLSTLVTASFLPNCNGYHALEVSDGSSDQSNPPVANEVHELDDGNSDPHSTVDNGTAPPILADENASNLVDEGSDNPSSTPPAVINPTNNSGNQNAPASPPKTRRSTSTPDGPATIPAARQSLFFSKAKVQELEAGKTADLKIYFENTGTEPIRNLIISPIVSTDISEWPFEIENNSYKLFFAEVKPKRLIQSGEMWLDTNEKNSEDSEHPEGTLRPYGHTQLSGLKLRSDAPGKTYDLRFDFSYYDTAIQRNVIVKDQHLYIKVTGNPDTTPSQVPDDNPNTNPSNPNGTAPNGTDPSENPDAAPGDEPLVFGGGGGGFVEEKINTPRLLLLGFKTKPGLVEAGKEFALELEFINSSPDTKLNNVKLTLSNSDSSFLPKTGSSTLFVPEIAKEAKVTLKMDWLCLATVDQKPHPIDIKIEAETDRHDDVSSNESIAIAVTQKARLDVSAITFLPESAQVSDSINMAFGVHNKGKVTLYNVSLHFPEDGPLKFQDSFLGNIEAGSKADFDNNLEVLRTLEPNEKPYFEIIYEDEFGKEYRSKHPYTLDIAEMPDMGMPDMGMSGSEFSEMPDDMGGPDGMDAGTHEGIRAQFETLPLWAKIAIPSAALILLVLIGRGIHKKRRHKKEFFDDEI
ncbi:MAG: hypothetical protein Q4P72_05880 [Eubacteriales bacterium]|nr:hypothetical protein [Eubacteriales bacterium]